MGNSFLNRYILLSLGKHQFQ